MNKSFLMAGMMMLATTLLAPMALAHAPAHPAMHHKGKIIGGPIHAPVTPKVSAPHR